MKASRSRPVAKANEPSTDAPDDANRYNRVQLTYTELLEQPQVIKNTIETLKEPFQQLREKLKNRTITKVYILGCGDSWFVGIGVRHAIEAILGIPCEAVQALDFGLYCCHVVTRSALVIGLSSSGNTLMVIDGLTKARQKGAFTIGVTNTPNSTLDVSFEGGILVPATRKGWPTQASLAAMVALILFTINLRDMWNLETQNKAFKLQRGLSTLPDLIEDVIVTQNQLIEQLAQKYVHHDYFMYTGAGPHYAAAAFGAAKVKELCPSYAWAIPLEEFHHYRTLKEDDVLFVIAPTGPSVARAKDTVDVGTYDGGHVITLVNDAETAVTEYATDALYLPHVDERLAPILFTVPVQLFAYHLAQAKFARG